MKINPFGTSGINPYKKQIGKIDQANKAGAANGTDKVEISSAAKELQQVNLSARTEKVEALKKQVQSGNYEINAQEVAKSIVNFYSKDK